MAERQKAGSDLAEEEERGVHSVGRGAGRLPGRMVECRWKGRGSDGQGLKWHWQDKGGNLGPSPGLPSITFWARKSPPDRSRGGSVVLA